MGLLMSPFARFPNKIIDVRMAGIFLVLKNVCICILKETSRKSDDEGGPRSPSDVYSSDDDKVINL